MRYIKSFNEDLILKEHYLYIDSIVPLNESFGDVSSYIKKVFDRISKASKWHKKKILIYALSALMLTSSSMGGFLNTIKTDQSIRTEMRNSPELKEVVQKKVKESIFKDPQTLKLSKEGWTHLKMSEGDPKHPGEPVLKAYKIGDGKITVGWGHAEPTKNSKYIVGQTISQEDAQKLLEKDASVAANGVRKIFSDWKKKGIDRKISQGMFDALVSMAFNMGIGGLRGSQLILDIKAGNFEEAGQKIKQTRVGTKFGGLVDRREKEKDLFLSYLDELKDVEQI